MKISYNHVKNIPLVKLALVSFIFVLKRKCLQLECSIKIYFLGFADRKYTSDNSSLHKNRSFPLRISSVNVTKSAGTADLVTFTEEILNGKLDFLCSRSPEIFQKF